jgi:ParB/RepB/Spo0J family partition protein
MGSEKFKKAQLAQKKRGELQEQRKDILYVDPRSLDIIEGFNIREEYGNIKELAASIEANGCKNPLMGYRHPEIEGRYIVTSGARRRLAGLQLVKKEKDILLPFLLQSQTYTDTDRMFDMLLDSGENHKPLTMLEQAEGVARLMAEPHSLSEAEVAARFHKSKTFIRNLILLRTAPEDIKEMVNSELIRPTLAITLMKEYGLEEAVRMIRDTYESMGFGKQAGEHEALENVEVNHDNDELEFKSDEDAPEADEKEFQEAPLKARMTRKDIGSHNEATGDKYKSIQYFKRLIDRSEREPVKEEHAAEFMLFQRMVQGDVNMRELEERYFGAPDIEPLEGKEEKEDEGGLVGNYPSREKQMNAELKADAEELF